MKTSPRTTISRDDFSPKSCRNHRLPEFPMPRSRENCSVPWKETIKICKKQQSVPVKPQMKEKPAQFMESLVISSEVRPARRVGLLADEHFVFRKHSHLKMSTTQDYADFQFNAVELQNKARCVCEQVAECAEGFEIDENGAVIVPMSVEKFELCTLDDVITAKKALNMSWRTNELWNLMTQLVDIFATLQEHRICHRDIKPANILVDETLKNYKITNFAIACEISEYKACGDMVELPAEGTPAYAGPLVYNALMNKQETVLIEPVKADVYSVGRIFDSILSNEDIGSHAEIREIMEKLLSVEYKDRPTFVELKKILEDKPHRVGEMSSDDVKAITMEVLRVFFDRKVKIEATINPTASDEANLEKQTHVLDLLSKKLSPQDFSHRLNNLGTALWLDNQNHLAAHCFDLVKTFQHSIHATDNRLYAVALKGLGDAYLDLEDYDQSLHHHVRSSILWSRLNGTNDREYADALYGIGSALLYKSDYGSAIQYLTQSVRCRRAVGANLQLAFTLVRLGDALHLNGDPERARECCDEAAHIQKRMCGTDHPEYAVTLGLLGDLLAESGEHAAALEHLSEAASIQRRLKGTRSCDLAVILQSMGKVYQMMREYSRAAEYMSESLKMEEELEKEKSDSYAIGVYNLGTVYQDMEDYVKAIELYETAMDIIYVGGNEALYEEFSERLQEARASLEAAEQSDIQMEVLKGRKQGKMLESRRME